PSVADFCFLLFAPPAIVGMLVLAKRPTSRARKRDHLTALDEALERLDHGDYGRCEVCGEPIPAERLEARPTATTCVRCATAHPR
ncbi:TraR/DksA family transcriptional regulator, partial [Streptomyces asiaticus]